MQSALEGETRQQGAGEGRRRATPAAAGVLIKAGKLVETLQRGLEQSVVPALSLPGTRTRIRQE